MERYGGGGHLSSCKCQSCLKLVRPLLWRTGEKLSWQTRTLKDFHRREDSMTMPVCKALIWNFLNVLHPPLPSGCVQLWGGANTGGDGGARCIIANWFRASVSAVPDWESSGPRKQLEGWRRSWLNNTTSLAPTSPDTSRSFIGNVKSGLWQKSGKDGENSQIFGIRV